MVDPESFTNRFNIQVDLVEAQRRFVNRVEYLVFRKPATLGDKLSTGLLFDAGEAAVRVALTLGESAAPGERFGLSFYTGGSFERTLQALEVVREVILEGVERKRVPPAGLQQFDKKITDLINQSEVDLQIRWREGKFLRSGARVLDNALVNDNLDWLKLDSKYGSVLTPFEKGLNHFLKARSDPGRYQDVITDVYEALEALAKIVTHNDRELSKNREKFISVLELPPAYGRMLSEYIDYACNYRHAESELNRRATPKEREVEGFVYLTGLMIRLATQPNLQH